MVERALQRWVGLVCRHARLTLGVIVALTALLAAVSVSQFRINSDLGSLIDQRAAWRTDFERFEAAFPEHMRTAVIVVRSRSVSALEQTTAALVERLQAAPEQFSAVSAPGSEAFFRDHALLFMAPDAIDATADRLAEAQPWLTAVAEGQGLAGILQLLETAVRNDPPERLQSVLVRLAQAANAAADGRTSPIAWTDEFMPLDEARYQLIFAKAPREFGAALPDAAFMANLRALIADVAAAADAPSADVAVGITGEIALQHEEIEAAVDGVSLAGWLAVVLLFAVLALGVRSARIIVATFTMLAIGVIWTAAFAMLTVGEFNTLSIVFIVMFFGLGVDFALHFSLRFQEAANHDTPSADPQTAITKALQRSTRSVGGAIGLCTLTTALGFLCFYPTAYRGLADLGVISAGGMAIAWFLTFTWLPAFFAWRGAPRPHVVDLPSSARVVGVLLKHRRKALGLLGVLALGSGWLATEARFDYSVLALKDPRSESVRMLRELQAQGLSTDYQLAIVADGPVDPAPLQALAQVREVRGPQDLVPAEQAEKLARIGDLELLLGSALYPLQQSGDAGDVRDAAAGLRATLLDHTGLDHAGLDDAGGTPDPAFRDAERSLAQALDRLDASSGDEPWQRFEQAVTQNLDEELDWLRRAVRVGPLTLADLPASVQNRVVNADGAMLTTVLPAQDIAQVEALSAFIEAVRGVYPQATGRPVIEWGVGGIVLDAFVEALVYALTGIVLVLLVALRSVVRVTLVLLPLALTGLMTAAIAVLSGVSLNMANILVLPLIFGLGVDNAIHVVERYLGTGDVESLLHTSTPRAVMLSTLTTLGAFAALSASPHQGTASMGFLLTVSIGLLLVFTIFLLPLLLAGMKARAPVTPA